MNTQNNQPLPRPYTLKELEVKYGKMAAGVIWQMRQQDRPKAK